MIEFKLIKGDPEFFILTHYNVYCDKVLIGRAYKMYRRGKRKIGGCNWKFEGEDEHYPEYFYTETRSNIKWTLEKISKGEHVRYSTIYFSF